ncbi:MAG: hypothetical protein WC436_03495 [Candidatus Babeliales bacterium]
MNKFINFKKLIFSLFFLSLSFSPAFLMEDETESSAPMEQREWEQMEQEDNQANMLREDEFSRLARAKHFNIFQNMHDDLLLEIISELDTPRDLYNILNINKKFRQITPNKYGHLDLCGYKNMTDNQLEQLLQRFPNIRSLDLSFCSNITDSGLQYIANCHNLKFLDLRLCSKIKDNSIFSILQGCHELQNLSLSCCKLITDASLQFLIYGCPKLKSLFLPRQTTDKGLQYLSQHGQHFEKLYFVGCPEITEDGLVSLISNCPNLKEINITKQATDKELICIANTCQELKELSIVNSNQITDNGIHSLIGCQNLRILNITGCSLISKTEIEALKAVRPDIKINA